MPDSTRRYTPKVKLQILAALKKNPKSRQAVLIEHAMSEDELQEWERRDQSRGALRLHATRRAPWARR